MIPNVFCNLLDMFFHFLPVSKKRVLFSSFHGQYNDNPKYISIEFNKRYPSIIQYWVVSEKSKMNDIPAYVRILKYNTLKYCYVKNTCFLYVENGAGAFLFDNSSRFFNLKKHLKNKKQYDFSTWHGNPIKHIGAQIPGNEFWNETTFFSSSDELTAGSEMVQKFFECAFVNSMPVNLYGTPRTDVLFYNNQDYVKLLKLKLKLPLDKKIILYAPTYRNNPECSGVDQMKSFDFSKLFSVLNKRFGGDWIFVFRLHNMVLLKIDIDSLLNEYSDLIINGNQFDDMAEYLLVSDVLLSDYSGCVFDVALTQKPCFLYALDREHYEQEERGLYFPIEKFPYSFADSFERLIIDISNYDENEIDLKRQEFLNYIGNIEDGKASERIVDHLIKRVGLEVD